MLKTEILLKSILRVSACLYVCVSCVCLWRQEEDLRSPAIGVTEGPLQKHQVFVTTTSSVLTHAEIISTY